MWHNAVILVAAIIAGVIQLQQAKARSSLMVQFRGGAKHPKPPAQTYTITPMELQEYHRDGFLLRKGLLQGKELTQLVESAEDVYFSTNNKDLNLPKFYKKLTFDLWRFKDEFAQLAFEDLPSLAAELLEFGRPSVLAETPENWTRENETIRILKDGFFGFKQKNNRGCGFHVDDAVFWPATYESTGVNFWIALSPMRIAEGGGIRVVNQSKVESVFEECRTAILQKTETGVPRTCDMEFVSPECHEIMMESSVIYDMEPGDALIWDRWTFHRSEPFQGDLVDENCVVGDDSTETQAQAEAEEYRLRYTIRYIPGTAKASGRLHPSQATGEVFDSPHYPQVWPTAIKTEINSIQKGLED